MNRLLIKFALLEKIKDFCSGLWPNYEAICEHRAEKFDNKNSKKTNFIKQIEFRKKSYKWIFCLLSLLPFWASAAASPSQDELQKIEQDIQLFKNQLDKNQTIEMKKEVEGQGLMIADWDAYAKDIEQIRKLEDQNEDLRKQIKKLEERKANLIQQQSQINQSSK